MVDAASNVKNTKKCPKCKEEIVEDAKKCKHCGADLRNWFIKHKIISVILGFVVIVIIVSGMNGSKSTTNLDSPTKVGDDVKTQEVVFGVGDIIKAGSFEVTITKAEERGSIGSQYFEKSPSEGGTYVGVQYKLKNISDKPIGMFSQASFKLLDSKGTKYSSDISASGSYATELNLDEKVLSDLNPGITVNGADIYEVSKELYDNGSWSIIVTTGGKDYKVTIK